MVGWGLESFLTGKFMKIYRKEGFIRTIERGRIARSRAITDNAGNRDVVPLVGQDQYGNRYYEEFNDDNNEHKLATRWVEYSDRRSWYMSGRKLPPEWHGWLHRIYDEAPTAENTSFHHPPFLKAHIGNESGFPRAVYPLGHTTNQYEKEFQQYVKSRVYHPWSPDESGDKKKYD